ncbi:uncharacterized protein LOC122015380 isoform X1 [Zingiber officinale]|uniref:TFIIS N-terminal domain-containing protein n=1 Tax=Zingiber officinale TaxID=94328 RepID=A0A8J5KMC2_ZINOF|nr:uncharacterized protein LOC122015380 isoform X1 [Zingiber officinale]XP_042428175.1 uncharacterized protein LOC122015380 isoform X1 [Zingiber officinale]KAG6482343.1 hypothetical protein ZIOFF_058974 [Zingiber officinale]
MSMNLREEVDQVLGKTRLEMHAGIQSGGRSPKQIDGLASNQLRTGSDGVRTTGSSLHSHSKGKRKDRIDHGLEPIKSECPSKPDGDSFSFKTESMVKLEIVKITDKGGLVSSEGVEKLVNLMQLDKIEKTMDVSVRTLVADVITATDRYDCLIRFVQLRGLLILDEWLQEVHKSKTSDGVSPKESDKTIEELLLSLLRALAKLPVNLNALQTCNIGKSVNNLRSHKNLEIQKKARGLIDTWKKRVDAEMTKINDTKFVTSNQPVWQVKPGSSDASLAGNRRSVGTEVATKNHVSQFPSSKTQSCKPGHSDATVKSPLLSQGSLKVGSALAISSGVGLKDPSCKAAANTGSTDVPSASAKEEKSSSSSQSQNNSQTYSSDHTKTAGTSRKEHAGSSSPGTINVAKVAGSSSRHRRSGNGISGTTAAGVQKEIHLSKSGSLNKAKTLEKSSQSGLLNEKSSDVPVAEHGNKHRLIVKLPNPVRSPERSATGGSIEDSTVGSGASSPGVSDKHEQGHRKVKLRSEAHWSHISRDSNKESRQSNDVNEQSVGAGGLRSPGADEPHLRSAKEIGKDLESARATCSSPGNEKGISSIEPRTRSSFRSINALIESCIRYSETSTPLATEDDNGMNLLASVAAGEISKSDLSSPNISHGTSPALEDVSTEAKLRLPSEGDAIHSPKSMLTDGDVAQRHVHSNEAVETDINMQDKNVCSMLNKDAPYPNEIILPGNSETAIALQDNNLPGRQGEQSHTAVSSYKSEDSCINSEKLIEEERGGTLSESEPADVMKHNNEGTSQLEKKPVTDEKVMDQYTDCKLEERSTSADKSKPVDCTHPNIDNNTCPSEVVTRDECQLAIATSGSEESEKLVVEETQSCTAPKEVAEVATSYDLKQPTRQSKIIISSDKSRTSESDKMESSDPELNGNHENNSSILPDESVRQSISSTGIAGAVGDLKMEEAQECASVGLANQVDPTSCIPQEIEHRLKLEGSVLSAAIEGVDEDISSPTETSFSVLPTADSAKLDFDLNEGIIGDDGHQDEASLSAATVNPSTIHLPIPSPFAIPISNGLPAQITVAAAAKGPFVPPENLLKNKGEAGWKGSAATSAFRPAEPRKVMKLTHSISETPSTNSGGKQCHTLLDFDLNEPDERVLEDMATTCSSSKARGAELGTESSLDVPMRGFGGLNLDLNRVDETDDGQSFASTSSGQDISLLAAGPALAEFPTREANMLRNFDLNNGPGLDEVSAESLTRNQNMKTASSVPFLFPVSSIRMNTNELGSVSSWFPPGSSYPAVAMPSFLSNREQLYPIVAASGAQRTMGPVTPSGPFGSDVFRGPVISSSLPMGFNPAAFPYGFTYGSNFPLPATSFSGGPTAFADSSSSVASGFPAMPSQLVGPAGTILSNYRKPHLASLPEGSNGSGSDNSRRWITSSLDLNSGPGNVDAEGKVERFTLAPRQLLNATSQGFAEEQVSMYTYPGGGLKRKEPEGSRDTDRSSYKQHSWQ